LGRRGRKKTPDGGLQSLKGGRRGPSPEPKQGYKRGTIIWEESLVESTRSTAGRIWGFVRAQGG